MVGQFVLKELAKRSVLSLQVEHQHLELDALLPQVLATDRRSSETTQRVGLRSKHRGRSEALCYLLIEQSLDHMVGHLITPENITFNAEPLS